MLNPQQLAGSYWARKRNRVSTAVIDDLQAPAWGTFTFGGRNPHNGDSIDIGGTDLKFRTNATQNDQVKIGDTLAETLANVLANIAANNPFPGVTVAASEDGLFILSIQPADISITLAASDATVSNSTLQKQTINARVPL